MTILWSHLRRYCFSEMEAARVHSKMNLIQCTKRMELMISKRKKLITLLLRHNLHGRKTFSNDRLRFYLCHFKWKKTFHSESKQNKRTNALPQKEQAREQEPRPKREKKHQSHCDFHSMKQQQQHQQRWSKWLQQKE